MARGPESGHAKGGHAVSVLRCKWYSTLKLVIAAAIFSFLKFWWSSPQTEGSSFPNQHPNTLILNLQHPLHQKRLCLPSQITELPDQEKRVHGPFQIFLAVQWTLTGAWFFSNSKSDSYCLKWSSSAFMLIKIDQVAMFLIQLEGKISNCAL